MLNIRKRNDFEEIYWPENWKLPEILNICVTNISNLFQETNDGKHWISYGHKRWRNFSHNWHPHCTFTLTLSLHETIAVIVILNIITGYDTILTAFNDTYIFSSTWCFCKIRIFLFWGKPIESQVDWYGSNWNHVWFELKNSFIKR